MPYTSPPSRIKGLPKHAQDIWVSSFNSAWKQDKNEEMCNKVAWSAVKKAGETTASSIDPKGKTTNITFAKKKKKKEGNKMEETKLGKNKMGVRDGTGPYKDSAQAQISSKGKRQLNGEPCPAKKKKMAKFVKWSYKQKTGLPDSAYAVVYTEGDKKVRKLPYKDSSGKVDVPHLRNALVRVSQGKTKLNPSMRARAMRTLKSVAKKYLKTYKETKSGEIMITAISKFEANTMDKIASIIDTLRKQSTNKKPTDEIFFEVKQISALIEDLEGILEVEKSKAEEPKEEIEETPKKETKEEEKKEEPKEEKKEEKEEKEEPKEKEADKKETPKEEKTEEPKEESEKEKKIEEEEEESKFAKEALKLCDDYKTEIEKSQKLVSKFKKESEELISENKELKQKLSKFEKEGYDKVFNSTLEKVSKFKKLSEQDKLSLRKHWLESKMSATALEELGRMTEDQMLSKLEEPKVTTKPSNMLEPAEKEKDFSKMSNEDKLDALANLQAKQRGFVQ